MVKLFSLSGRRMRYMRPAKDRIGDGFHQHIYWTGLDVAGGRHEGELNN